MGYPNPAELPSPSQFYSILAAVSPPVDSSINLFVDTADVYCHPFDDRHQIDKRIATAAETLPIKISTKSGMNRISNESTGWREGNSLSIREQILAAKNACSPNQNEPLFLWQMHHTNDRHLVEAMTVAKSMVEEGHLLHVGLCNATTSQIATALQITPLLTVQNEYSLFNREAEKPLEASSSSSSKKGVMEMCKNSNIVFVGYAPLGGLKTRRSQRQVGTKSPALVRIASDLNATTESCAIATLLARGRIMGVKMLVLVGGRTLDHVKDSVLVGSQLTITDSQCRAIMKYS